MSVSSQAPRSSKDPVRIVYHAGNRTFARLFNESSLDELKAVVRQKLNVGAGADVSLKQMGSGALLDLEDDGDFQAFRVLLKSSVSVDIQVTVGPSQGPVVPPRVATQPREGQSASKPTTTTLDVLPSRGPAGAVTSTRVTRTTNPNLCKTAPASRKETSDRDDVATPDEPMKRHLNPRLRQHPYYRFEREPSDDVDVTSTEEPMEQDIPLHSIAVTPVASAKTAESSAVSKPDGANIVASDKPTEQPSDQSSVRDGASYKMIALRGGPRRMITAMKTVVKRKSSIDEVDTTAKEQRGLGHSAAAAPVASTKTAEPPALKPDSAQEPPKKKLKKEGKKKEVQISDSPVVGPSTAKPKAKKSASGSKADASEPKDADASEPPVKKQRKSKKDDGAGKKISKSAGQDDRDQLVGQRSNQGVAAVLQPEKPAGPSVLDGASETLRSEVTKAPTGGVCASIPRTSASTTVQSEVAAAIISCYLSKASGTVPSIPPQKRKSVKRVTKESSASSSALPTAPVSVPDPLSYETRNLLAEHRPGRAVLTNETSQQTPGLNGPPCPICLEEPFHIRYCCPTVLKGPDAIRERLEELRRTNAGNEQSLIKQLEGLLRDSEATPEPSVDAAPTDDVELGKVLPPSSASIPRTPHIPSNSHPSEVTVEGRGEGSSSESSDDMDGEAERQELPAVPRKKIPEERSLLSDDGLEAIVRGPMSKQKSVLNLLDRIIGDENDEGSSSEDDEAELEEDTDEEAGQSRRRSSRRILRSSDLESEADESRSPSSSCSNDNAPKNVGPSVQSVNESAKESTSFQNGDVVMTDGINPPASEEQHESSNEARRPEPEDHMVVDEPVEPKGVITMTEEQTSSPVTRAFVPQPSNLLGNEPQDASEMPVQPTPDQDDSVPVTTEVPQEVEVDPIEPADDLVPPSGSHSTNIDPIEAPSEELGSLFPNATQPTPRPGVSKRIKTRNGEVPDKADQPVLLQQITPQPTDKASPLPAKGKSRRKVPETPAPTRKSPRFSITPSTSTPPVVLLNHRVRSSEVTKTLAKDSEDGSKDDAVGNGSCIVPTPSLNRWETLVEQSSPSMQLDEPLVPVDELMSSSPHPEDDLIREYANGKQKVGPRKSAGSGQAESSQEKERLFDLTASQTPFPYSQKQINLIATVTPNWKDSEGTTDSEDEVRAAVKKRTTMSARYRPLSQLASEAIFSPSLLTPSNKSVMNRETKKRAVDEESSSSTSSEDEDDEDEANGSEHIPRGRMAGSELETKKRQSLSSKI